MRKNNMKTPEEKEIIVKRYLNGETPTKLADEYEINKRRIYIWSKKYQESGIKGLVSNTGKHSSSSNHMGLHSTKTSAATNTAARAVQYRTEPFIFKWKTS